MKHISENVFQGGVQKSVETGDVIYGWPQGSKCRIQGVKVVNIQDNQTQSNTHSRNS